MELALNDITGLNTISIADAVSGTAGKLDEIAIGTRGVSGSADELTKIYQERASTAEASTAPVSDPANTVKQSLRTLETARWWRGHAPAGAPRAGRGTRRAQVCGCSA